eukprot:3933877-Rhodomonas_salina.1
MSTCQCSANGLVFVPEINEHYPCNLKLRRTRENLPGYAILSRARIPQRKYPGTRVPRRRSCFGFQVRTRVDTPQVLARQVCGCKVECLARHSRVPGYPGTLYPGYPVKYPGNNAFVRNPPGNP